MNIESKVNVTEKDMENIMGKIVDKISTTVFKLIETKITSMLEEKYTSQIDKYFYNQISTTLSKEYTPVSEDGELTGKTTSFKKKVIELQSMYFDEITKSLPSQIEDNVEKYSELFENKMVQKIKYFLNKFSKNTLEKMDESIETAVILIRENSNIDFEDKIIEWDKAIKREMVDLVKKEFDKKLSSI